MGTLVIGHSTRLFAGTAHLTAVNREEMKPVFNTYMFVPLKFNVCVCVYVCVCVCVCACVSVTVYLCPFWVADRIGDDVLKSTEGEILSIHLSIRPPSDGPGCLVLIWGSKGMARQMDR